MFHSARRDRNHRAWLAKILKAGRLWSLQTSIPISQLLTLLNTCFVYSISVKAGEDFFPRALFRESLLTALNAAMYYNAGHDLCGRTLAGDGGEVPCCCCHHSPASIQLLYSFSIAGFIDCVMEKQMSMEIK